MENKMKQVSLLFDTLQEANDERQKDIRRAHNKDKYDPDEPVSDENFRWILRTLSITLLTKNTVTDVSSDDIADLIMVTDMIATQRKVNVAACVVSKFNYDSKIMKTDLFLAEDGSRWYRESLEMVDTNKGH